MPSISDQLLMSRGDLTNFPKETVDLILEMQKDGWRGHRNSQGHVKMLAPDGETYVMATQNPRSPHYVRSGYRQYKKKNGEDVQKEKPKTTQKWPCPRPQCPKVYGTEEQLSVHISVDHEKLLKCPDCPTVRPTQQKLNIHRTHAHGYESPRKAQRKKQEAARKAKEDVAVAREFLETVVEGIKEDARKDKEEFEEFKDDIEVKRINMADSPKFDPTVLDEFTKENPEVVRTFDTATVEPMTPRAKAFKELGAKFINDGLVVVPDDWTPKFTPEGEFQIQVGAEPTIKGDGIIPGRDSWVMDMSGVMDMTVEQLLKSMYAAGIEMEIRLWKEN